MDMIRLDNPETGDWVEVRTLQMPRTYLDGVGAVSFCVWESWHKQGERNPGYLYARLWGPTDAFGFSQTLDIAVGERQRQGWVRTLVSEG